MCLHHDGDSFENPFAYLPKSWIDIFGRQYGWTEVINLLRNTEKTKNEAKDKAAGAFEGSTTLPPPPVDFSSMPGQRPLPTIASEETKSFRDRVSEAGSRSSSIASRKSPPSHRSLGHQSQTDPASNRGGDTSDNQSSVVQNGPPVERREVITEPTNAPPAVTDSDIGNVPAEFTLPAKAIELDLLDCDVIPALIAGVLSGTNVNEFLGRLEVLAYTGTRRSDFMCRRFFFTKYFRHWQEEDSTGKQTPILFNTSTSLWRSKVRRVYWVGHSGSVRSVLA